VSNEGRKAGEAVWNLLADGDPMTMRELTAATGYRRENVMVGLRWLRREFSTSNINVLSVYEREHKRHVFIICDDARMAAEYASGHLRTDKARLVGLRNVMASFPIPAIYRRSLDRLVEDFDDLIALVGEQQ
jgi:Winged helix-turn-helix domain (DUF2582)